MEINKIFNEDCIEGMKKLPDECVDLVVTDPPYLIKYKTSHRKDKTHRFGKEILNDDNEQLIIDYIEQCYRIMKPNTAMYMFCSPAKVDFFKQQLEKKFKIKNMIIWVKNNHSMGDLKASFGGKYEIVFLVNKGRKSIEGKRITDIWEFNRVSGKSQLHQNQKPLALIEQCLDKHSVEDDVVFDGFMGAGTTAVACLRKNRRFIGYELDEGYYDIASERVQKELDKIGTK